MEQFYYNPNWINFLPFQTIQNLLSRYFTSFECYQKFVNEEKWELSVDLKEKCLPVMPDFDRILDELMANSIVMYIWDSHQNVRTTKLPIKQSVCGIKCLIVLGANSRVFELLLANIHNFFEALQNNLNDIFYKNLDDRNFHELIKFSDILKKRLNKDNTIIFNLKSNEEFFVPGVTEDLNEGILSNILQIVLKSDYMCLVLS
ncbi:hypothetical protein RF11_00868 [Thelohanellus kitauei]|uniref:Uncharacterized protein n=1 Tax=Thelohanellus kitauei TaxID=669202 RepID=A0A0C2N347_THEKT|nr:hypothetical protein RF11_00868 [Thelohanellus kitauei]